MAKYSKKQKTSPQTQDEAMAMAKGIQRPGQAKEQTRLIAQGIQKGIDHYKKQQKAKTRKLDKKLKSISSKNEQSQDNRDPVRESVQYKQHWLPWLLLVITWLGIAVFLLVIN